MAGGEAAAVGGVPRVQTRAGAVGWVRRHGFELALIFPLVAYVLVLTVAPIIDTVRISFSAPHVGFGTVKSYRTIFGDTVFRHAVINTVRLVLTGDVPCVCAIGPTRITYTSWKTVRTASTALLAPNTCVLTLARMTMRSPTWM